MSSHSNRTTGLEEFAFTAPDAIRPGPRLSRCPDRAFSPEPAPVWNAWLPLLPDARSPTAAFGSPLRPLDLERKTIPVHLRHPNQPAMIHSSLNMPRRQAIRLLGLGLPLSLSAVRAAPSTAAGEPPHIGDFTLPHFAGGPPFRWAESRGKYVALHFLLKTECPVCLRHTRTHLKRAQELPEARQIFIKPDSEPEIRQWAKDLPADLPLYRDAEAALAVRLGIPGGYAFHGETVHYPALILVDPKGRECFRHVGKDNRDRIDFDRLTALIREHQGRGKQ